MQAPIMEEKAEIFTFEKGDLVWYNTKQGYALPGKITEVDSASSTAWVQSNDKKEEIAEFHFNDLQKRASDAMCFEDLVQLDDLCNPAVLWALKTRFEYGKTYTYIGEMLISINPYRHLDVYGPEIMEQYRKKMTTSLPSHVYGFAEMVQRRLYAFDTSQWIIATGITGSGKTELCKLMVQYFAEGCKREMKCERNLFISNQQTTLMLALIREAAFNDKLYHAMHILQSFLNAKTAANDNSTRGGKIYSLQYQNKKLIGAKVACCLLEKTRLGKCVKLSSREENNFELLENALEIIKITLDQRHYIFRLLSAILHLGNIYFEEQTEDSNRRLVIANPNEVQWVAYLLQMDPDEITHRLTTKVIESRDQKVVHALTLDRALDIRDAIAKELYVGLIRWIIMKINKQLCDTGDDCNEINILDLYGFECFKVNFFEQLCINYINERVQRLFVRVQFCSEQMEYIREDVVWDRNVGANLLNNSIFNILAKQPNGILSLLDDECSFPKGSDESFLIKCQNNYDDSPLFTAKTKRQPGFVVQHFFGHARYNVLGFVDKNREVHSAQTVEFLLESQNILIAQMFEKQKLALSKRKEESENFDTYRIRAPTFAMQLHEEFNQLTKRIENVHSVRIGSCRYGCLKPEAATVETKDEKNMCLYILTSLAHQYFQDFRIGKTKVFMKDIVAEHLDSILSERLSSSVIIIQKYCRGLLARRKFHHLYDWITHLQAIVRGSQARQLFCKIRKKFSLIKAKMAEEAQQYAKQSRNLEVFRELSIKPNSQDSNANLQQRNSCAIVSVNHLEMPQNLAEMLLTTTNLDADKNIVRADRLIASHHEQEFILPHDLHEYSFNKYAQQHFKILRYMNDTSLSSSQEIILSNYIIQKGIDNKNLRDEIYAQVINQIHGNPNQANAERGWRLLGLCASAFPPTDAMFKYALKGISECTGWTVSLECQDAVIRLNGNQYLLDVLSYIELPQLFPAQKSDYLITMKQHKKPHLEPSTIQERLEALERRPNLRTLVSDDFHSSKLKNGGSIRSLVHKARLQRGEKLDSASVKQEWLNWNEKCAAQNKMRPGHLNLDHDGSVTNNARCQSRMSSNSYQTDHSILTADTSNQTRPPKQNCQNYDKENVDKKNSIPAEQAVIQDIAYMSITATIKGGGDESDNKNQPVAVEQAQTMYSSLYSFMPQYASPVFMMMPYDAARMFMPNQRDSQVQGMQQFSNVKAQGNFNADQANVLMPVPLMPVPFGSYMQANSIGQEAFKGPSNMLPLSILQEYQHPLPPNGVGSDVMNTSFNPHVVNPNSTDEPCVHSIICLVMKFRHFAAMKSKNEDDSNQKLFYQWEQISKSDAAAKCKPLSTPTKTLIEEETRSLLSRDSFASRDIINRNNTKSVASLDASKEHENIDNSNYSTLTTSENKIHQKESGNMKTLSREHLYGNLTYDSENRWINPCENVCQTEDDRCRSNTPTAYRLEQPQLTSAESFDTLPVLHRDASNLFFPNDSLQDPAALDAIFYQIVRDTFNEKDSFRLEKAEHIDHTEATENEFLLSTVNGVIIRVSTKSGEEITNLANKYMFGPNQVDFISNEKEICLQM
ncbi:putative myosin head [Trichinella spiralis]|uniref:putative myosin head n=1 Tax=Trichinella spiralis TaxID=6334 RepID=UPI0001EFB529|nr:putative myosin head [Trichinella spiralis]